MNAVHGMRREIKKLRAVLRLVRGTTGKGAYRRCIQLLRQAASVLAAPRDACVQHRAFRELRRHFDGKISNRSAARIESALRARCRRETQHFLEGDSRARLKRILRKMKRRLDDLKIRSDGWAAIGPGIEHCYCRGQKARQRVLAEPSSEQFHLWRKRVKDLGYQLRLLRRIGPERWRGMVKKLDALGELLGEDHDLA
ncbi:MAG: CHAD domain-containing protein, partial [Verrucomicrobia bacterium]|nr:CHAD domain-containing protein [Verrucomicrobiota bacterium]